MDEQSGFSGERLARIPRFLEGQVAAGALPGALTLIWRRGRVAHLSLAGVRDIARQAPMQADTIFRLYSMTKPVTTVALLMLLEEGRVALDDPVAKFIPGFSDLKPQTRPMTVLDLLRHTSGLTYGFHNRTPVDAQYRAQRISEMDTEGGLPAMIAQLQKLPLEYAPGEAWIYSVATDVAGYLIQIIAGQSYADFVRQRILAPLKMTDTDFLVPDGKRDRFAACYLQQPANAGGGLELFTAYPNEKYFAAPKLESGGGGLAGTASDYLRFCRMLLNGGALEDVRLLSPKTVALMTANQLPDGKEIADLSPAADAFNESGYRGVGFGLGVAVTLDPARTGIPGTAGEFAWGGMASTAFIVDPREDMAVVFMTQVITDTARRVRLRRDLRTLIYGAMTQSYA